MAVAHFGGDAVFCEGGIEFQTRDLGFRDVLPTAGVPTFEREAKLESGFGFGTVQVFGELIAEGLSDFCGEVEVGERVVCGEAEVDDGFFHRELDSANLGPVFVCQLNVTVQRGGGGRRVGGEIVGQLGAGCENRGRGSVAMEEGKFDGGCFEAAKRLNDPDFATYHEALVVDLDDGRSGPIFHLCCDGVIAFAGDAEEFFGEFETESGSEPVEVGDGAGADEVEVLAEDERIGEFAIDL